LIVKLRTFAYLQFDLQLYLVQKRGVVFIQKTPHFEQPRSPLNYSSSSHSKILGSIPGLLQAGICSPISNGSETPGQSSGLFGIA